MGKLALYGALGGLGKGLEQQYLLDRESGEAKAKDSRTFQLERLRQKGALDRQSASDKTASARLQEKSDIDTAAVAQAAKVEEGTSTTKHERAMEIEKMRQDAETSRATMRITEKDPPFEHSRTKASQVFDAATGNTIVTPAQNTVTDKRTNVTYVQEGLSFVPEGWEPPTPGQLAAGQKASEAWLLKAPNLDEAAKRSFVFLQSFGFIPAQYFNKYGRGGATSKVTEKGSTTEIQPANQ